MKTPALSESMQAKEPSVARGGWPAGAPTELYRGPRYAKPAAPPQAAPPPAPAHVRPAMQRVRDTRNGCESLVWSIDKGGWHQPPGAKWSNQPSAVGENFHTRWAPPDTLEKGVPNLNVRTSNRGLLPQQAPSPAPASSYSVAPPGTFDGVQARADKYAGGDGKYPWAPPRHDYDQLWAEPFAPPGMGSPKAAGTSVTLRGGSWPVDMTVPP